MTSLPKNNNLPLNQDEQTQGNQLFPVFVKLNNLHTVLIGAGNVGLEKLAALLNNSPLARVTVISKTFLPQIHNLASEYAGVKISQKAFEESDLNEADMVIAATNNSGLNEQVRKAAHERKLLINVADKPELCDFYLGSIVKKGDLKIAISTNGKSPTVAKRLKEVLNESLPAELDTTLQQMSSLRNSLSGDFAYKVKRLNEVTSVLVKKKVGYVNGMAWYLWGAAIIGVAVLAEAFLR